MSLIPQSIISSGTFHSKKHSVNSIIMNERFRDNHPNDHMNTSNVELQTNYSDMNNSKSVRNNWSSRLYFLLSSISFVVDLTTVFRFPYLCYIHGGVEFFIAYLIMLTLCIVPLFYMELMIGQYFRQGCISVWKITLLFKGIGWASCIITFLGTLHYNTIIAWAFFYLFASFQSELPWSNCNHSWNTPYCKEISTNNLSHVNFTMTTAAKEFFEIRMLGVDKSTGFGDFGTVQWEVCCCLLLINVILFLSLFDGVKVLEKVSWITAGVPYLATFIILIRGVTLSNAGYGIKTFLTPSMRKLLGWKVWFDASSQAFFSLGVGFGVHIAYGSYNKINNPAYVDCIITTAMNVCFSLLNSISLYSFLGYLSHQYGVSIQENVDGNLGLIFIVYTSAFSTLRAPHLWCMLLFFMLITLGLGSANGATESFLAALCDECTIFNLKLKKYFRLGLTIAFLSLSFIISIPNVCMGGYYMVHFLDQNACSTSVVCTCLIECFAIVYVYGIHNLSRNMQEITYKQVHFITRLILKIFVPSILIFMLLCKILTSTNAEISVGGKFYHYPDWSIIGIWMLCLIVLIPIPINMIVQLINVRKRGKSWYIRTAMLITPLEEHDELQQTGYCKRFKINHWLKI
ncbi:unnamed protein product [Schistosoma turkestanicum]|nr:unnamed protein product [Schistosoma turkestanicum]